MTRAQLLREFRRLITSWLLLAIQRLTPEKDLEAHMAIGVLADVMRRSDG